MKTERKKFECRLKIMEKVATDEVLLGADMTPLSHPQQRSATNVWFESRRKLIQKG